MATKKKMLQAAAGNAGGEALNVEDVFSTYLYDGTSSAQTITNGIDLSGEGGLTWIKSRNFSASHALFDTERGGGSYLSSNEALGNETPLSAPLTFNSDGFTINTQADSWNGTYYSNDYASWTFRKAPKFFDVVTYTGTGAAQTISHNLGATVGSIFIKCTSDASSWAVYHNGLTDPSEHYLLLNSTTGAVTHEGALLWNSTLPTDSEFSIGAATVHNLSGRTYVAYLFAHNDGDGGFGADGDADIIKCGSFTGNGSETNGTEVDLGFEPQWLLVKAASTTADWFLVDSMRGWGPPNTGQSSTLKPNASDAESSNAYNTVELNSTGFKLHSVSDDWNGNGETYIYIAIRRGTKVPESATEVFDVNFASATATNPAVISTIPTIDMAILSSRTGTDKHYLASRLTQAYLKPNSTGAEAGAGSATWRFDNQNGFYGTTGTLGTNYFAWMWKRAPGFFDVVAYTGTGSLTPIGHNLGVEPELAIFKRRNDVQDWWVIQYPEDLSLRLNTTAAGTTADAATYGAVTSTTMVPYLNTNGQAYIAYLFASLPGISKVGSYTGTGSTQQTIDCGFTSGARFVLIKRSSGTSQWYVFDTERGITSTANDGVLYLNLTNAEQPESSAIGIDAIQPDSSGFKVQYGDLNSSGATFIFYAIA